MKKLVNHDGRAHALLSASKADRWLNCTPSARLEEPFADTTSEAAKEGTLAHELSELLLAVELSGGDSDESEHFEAIKTNPLYSEAMLQHAEDYVVFIMERYNEARVRSTDAQIFLEARLNLTDYIPEGFGTGDVVIISDGLLEIIDLKYGKGVPVSAQENRQMMLYSLGALREYDYLYDLHTVRMTIYQPRLDSVSTYEVVTDNLRKWAEEELIPRAQMAFDGVGEFVPGKHCQFCKVKPTCKALADYNLEVAKYDFLGANLLTPAEVADILSRKKMFLDWIGSVDDYALAQALNGVKFPGFKLVEGRSNRIITDKAVAASKLIAAGLEADKVYKPQELRGLTELEKAAGKKTFDAVLAGLITKPEGKPTLVPADDKRPEWTSAAALAKEFEND